MRKRYVNPEEEWNSFLPSLADDSVVYAYSANKDKCYESA